MLIPPDSLPGWKVTTIGDDIAWLQPGPDGRLWAINPESGYFGVAPGTNARTNRNAFEMVRQDTLFTNVALTAEQRALVGGPAWPARHRLAGATVRSQERSSRASEFTLHGLRDAEPGLRPSAAEDPRGVPISAIIFGGRRRQLAPLVYEARSWSHGVLVGASVASETTAAATGQVGVVRRDPMAMKPFCGYNFGDYWAHWFPSAAVSGIRRGSFTSTGSARMPPASSYGRDSARTCACCRGYSSAARGRAARRGDANRIHAARVGSGHRRTWTSTPPTWPN